MKILAIGAHYDDVELRCAGTLLKAKDKDWDISLVVCSDSCAGGDGEIREKEQNKVNKMMGYKAIWELYFEDGMLTHSKLLVAELEKIIELAEPDYIFTHDENDFHQDHVAVAKSVKSCNRMAKFGLVTFPGQDIKLPFEPNLYVDITKYFDKKLEIIDEYKSQKDKPWAQRDDTIARHLGTWIGKYVENFHIKFMKI